MTMKPRDIRELLRGKIDPELGKVLVALAEDQVEVKQMIRELLLMFGKMADLMHVHTLIIDSVKKDPRLNAKATEALVKTVEGMSTDHSSIVQSEAIGDNDDA